MHSESSGPRSEPAACVAAATWAATVASEGFCAAGVCAQPCTRATAAARAAVFREREGTIGVSMPSLRLVLETPFCGAQAYSIVAPEACTMLFHFS